MILNVWKEAKVQPTDCDGTFLPGWGLGKGRVERTHAASDQQDLGDIPPHSLSPSLCPSPSLFIFYLLFNASSPGGVGKITSYCLGTPACDSVHTWAPSPPAASSPLPSHQTNAHCPLWGRGSQAKHLFLLGPQLQPINRHHQPGSRMATILSLQCHGAPACSPHLSVPTPGSLRVSRMAVFAGWELGRKRTGGACSWSPKPTLERIFSGSGRSPEMATHCSMLVWKIPQTGEPGRLHSVQATGSWRVGHDWAFTHTRTLPKERGSDPWAWHPLSAHISPP